MKSRPVLMLGIAGLLLISSAAAKDKEPAGQTVDTGSFGVFMNGHRIATEKFSIQQSNVGSVATSEFKSEPGVEPAAQTSQLELALNGDLKKYEWKETIPGKAHAVAVAGRVSATDRSSGVPSAPLQE